MSLFLYYKISGKMQSGEMNSVKDCSHTAPPGIKPTQFDKCTMHDYFHYSAGNLNLHPQR